MWNCPVCETQNSEEFYKCEVCKTPRLSTPHGHSPDNTLSVLTAKPNSTGKSYSLPLSPTKVKRQVTIGLVIGVAVGLCAVGFSILAVNGLESQVKQFNLPTPYMETFPIPNNSANTPEVAASLTPHIIVMVPSLNGEENIIAQETMDNSISPEQFIRNYFAAINDRSYGLAWSMLSKKFQSNHTYDEYATWWDTVNKVEIILIEIRSQSDYEVFINVEADYHYKNGVVATGHTEYKLVRNDLTISWLFDPN